LNDILKCCANQRFIQQILCKRSNTFKISRQISSD
jgi:hypothetical protein